MIAGDLRVTRSSDGMMTFSIHTDLIMAPNASGNEGDLFITTMPQNDFSSWRRQFNPRPVQISGRYAGTAEQVICPVEDVTVTDLETLTKYSMKLYNRTHFVLEGPLHMSIYTF
jgi:hypothetical protein